MSQAKVHQISKLTKSSSKDTHRAGGADRIFPAVVSHTASIIWQCSSHHCCTHPGLHLLPPLRVAWQIVSMLFTCVVSSSSALVACVCACRLFHTSKASVNTDIRRGSHPTEHENRQSRKTGLSQQIKCRVKTARLAHRRSGKCLISLSSCWSKRNVQYAHTRH